MKSAAILASQAERGCALIPKKHWMGTSVSHPVLFLALYNINCDFIRMRIKKRPRIAVRANYQWDFCPRFLIQTHANTAKTA